MTLHTIALIVVVTAVAYLFFAYAIGGPLMLLRRLLQMVSRRRLRYRSRHDEVLATSRFTIPVTIILPTEGEDAAAAAEHLLTLNYPEVEVIVVNDGSIPGLEALRERFELNACEVFYRRSLETSPVRAIYRSASEPRLLVLDCATETRGDALNCGVNLARFRYICCADIRGRYHRDALLEGMHAAVEDPALVVGITTSLGPIAMPSEGTHAVDPPDGVWPALHRLSALRVVLGRNNRRRLSISPEELPGFTLWRRDAVVEIGGFSPQLDAEQVELTFRMHRHHLAARRDYRIVHISEPVGIPAGGETLSGLVAQQQKRQQAMGAILWQYRSLFLQPRYGRVGVVDLPVYLFSTMVVPWLELISLLALPFSAVMGVLTFPQLLLMIVAIGIGNGILLNTAMLLGPATAPQDVTLSRMIMLGPLELFMSRPVQLYSRLTGMFRMFNRPSAIRPA
jgi:cellulose synthase/poly-beta-1,6-N-acetylglucosamine synthase-like glycosyltransferase